MDDALRRAWRLWYEDPADKRDLDQIVRDVFVAAPPDRLGPWLIDGVGIEALVHALVAAVEDPTDIVVELEHAVVTAEEADRG